MKIVTPNGRIGTAHWRVEGVAKVTGQALYGADQKPVLSREDRGRQSTQDSEAAAVMAGKPLLHAAVRTSPIASGKITGINENRARAIQGVCEILTYKNVGKRIKPGKPLLESGYMSRAVAPLSSPEIHFGDQVIAMVIADSLEIAQQAAEAIDFMFEAKSPAASFDSPSAEVVKAKALGKTELKSGDVKKAFAKSAVCVDEWYETPPQHHNPIELFQTTCAWRTEEDGKEQLIIWESTQNTRGFQHGLAEQLRLKPSQVRILSPFIGGAFGSKGELGQFTSLVAFASRQLGAPVRFVSSRRQAFSLRTFRAETRHHLRLGATAEGKLLALDHESWELTSRDEKFATAGSDSTSRLYACANVRTLVHNVETDRQAPGFMRAPPEMPYLFVMEAAMDELSYKLGIDPLDLRRRNDTLVELATDRPYTSRSLLQAIDRGAELFGWSERTPEPRSMGDADDLIGWGFASAFYPTQIGPADCRITLELRTVGTRTEPHAMVEVGTHEIGTGIRTVVALTVADLLGLPMEAIEVRIGDSELPAAPLSAGSNSTATICSVLAKCCEAIREKLAKAAVKEKRGALHGVNPNLVRLIDGYAVFTHDPKTAAPHHPQQSSAKPEQDLANDSVPRQPSEPLPVALRRVARGKPLVQKMTNTPHGAPPVIGPALVRKGKPIMVGGSNLKDRMQFAHGAHFVEVRVSRATGMIRVPRMVGVFAGGRIINPRTAYAQLQGGQVWGLSSALHEATEIDPLLGRYTNSNLAEYHVPVARDICDITTVMLEEEDTLVNPLGIKGIGELGVTGLAAAIANAVFHATGVRVRKLPIRLDTVLAATQP
ncbi:MAG: xanthine dehydrogenase family protein molybdopterin-binding subunit [Janthinobacterium lividum]